MVFYKHQIQKPKRDKAMNSIIDINHQVG